MTRISINLLPIEILAQESKKTKFYQIQSLGVIIILALAFLTSVTVAMRIMQNQSIKEVTAKVSQTQQKIINLKDTQATLLLLKNRLEVINQYWGASSKQAEMYQLIEKLMPSSISINNISVDKSSILTFAIAVPDSDTLETLINNLTLKELNEDKISKVSIESLNRGREGIYRVSLQVIPK